MVYGVGGAAATINSLLCFLKSLHVWKGKKRSYCKNDVSFGFAGHSRVLTPFFRGSGGLILIDYPFPSTARPSPGHVSAHSPSCPERTESRPAAAELPPPRTPHSGATTRPRPLPLTAPPLPLRALPRG